eukprot:COSAG02_NODE_62780_length_265_cov_0.578313_1_plen_81_part_01
MVQAHYDTTNHRATENQESLFKKIANYCLVFAKATEINGVVETSPEPPKNFEDGYKKLLETVLLICVVFLNKSPIGLDCP